MGCYQKKKIPAVGENTEKLELMHICRHVKWCSCSGKQCCFPQKIKELSYVVVSLWGTHSKEFRARSQTSQHVYQYYYNQEGEVIQLSIV